MCSNDDKFRRIAANFENAARKAGVAAEFQIYQLRSQSPSTAEVRQAHKQLLAFFPDSVVNLTGGTKLMSPGAYLGASEFVLVPMLYCDTANKSFIQVGEYSLPASLADFGNVAASLTVPVVMAAQGKDFKESPITPELLAYGVKAWELRQENHEAVAAWTGAIRDSLPRDKNGRLPKARVLLEDYLRKPLPAAHSPAAEAYLDAAVEAGIIRVDVSGSNRILGYRCAPRQKTEDFCPLSVVRCRKKTEDRCAPRQKTEDLKRPHLFMFVILCPLSACLRRRHQARPPRLACSSLLSRTLLSLPMTWFDEAFPPVPYERGQPGEKQKILEFGSLRY